MPHSRLISFRCLIILASFLLSFGVMMPATGFAQSAIHLPVMHGSSSATNHLSTRFTYQNDATMTDPGLDYHDLTSGTNALAKSWSIVASPNQGSNGNVLSGVAAVSASNIWAVGNYYNSRGVSQTLIEQWNGTSWSIVKSPNQGSRDNYLYGVAAVSASNIWAVGDYFNSSGTPQTLIEQWNGTSWSIVASPNQGSSNNQLFGVAAVSASNIWAVGDYDVGNGTILTLIEQWKGTSWSIVTSPNQNSNSNSLFGVARVPGSSNIWAVGDYYNSSIIANQTLIEQWNGKSWSIVASPNQDSNSNQLFAVAAVSTSDIWAVGNYNIGVPQTLIEQWNGTKWSIVASPNQGSDINYLYGVTVVSANNIWAVGYYNNLKISAYQTLIEQWNGTKWSIVASPNQGSTNNQLLSVARVPGSSNMWAVGYYGPLAPTSTLIEFYG